MRYIYILSILAFASCADATPDATPAELDAAAQAGCRMADSAKSFNAESKERIGAIMAIRARETELRRAGFSSCADTFAASATARLQNNESE